MLIQYYYRWLSATCFLLSLAIAFGYEVATGSEIPLVVFFLCYMGCIALVELRKTFDKK